MILYSIKLCHLHFFFKMQENLAPSKAVQIFIFQVSKINRKMKKD